MPTDDSPPTPELGPNHNPPKDASSPLGGALTENLAKIGQAIAPLARSREQLTDAVRPFLEIGLHVNRALDTFRNNLPKLVVAVDKYRQQFLPALVAVAEGMARFPARLKGNLLVLAREGWYIDPEWPLPTSMQLEQELADGSKSEVAEWLVSYFRLQLDPIEKRLLARHPTRARILATAFSAHREGKYELSVPVFMAQADGITYDLRKRQLYSRNQKKGLQSAGTDEMEFVFISPLAAPTPINATEGEREHDFIGLNRHTVLHGQDLEYGTEENSLKLVSMLNYVSFALSHQDDT